MKPIELLSPAGSYQSLVAAVQSGADAVYIGGSKFSARQSAKNFTVEEMQRWVDYCHIYNVKVYVAVNTLIKEHELESLAQYAIELNEIGVDGVIMQDIGAARVFKETVPYMELHASTQMTVTTLDGVRYLEQMGFSRVVLARELAKEEIAYICKHAKAEIEIFVHGALCMCYSGQCLMSSIIGGRSGNRGCCAQPCRLFYELTDGKSTAKQGHLLSPKDIALLEELEAIKQIGVKSLKIEGRLKRPEYVSAVTGIYRKYLNTPQKVTPEDWKELNDAFNRGGFSKAYFNRELGSQMMSFDNPGDQSARLFSDDVKKRLNETNWYRKIPVNLYVTFQTGRPMELTIDDQEYHCITVKSEKLIEPAKNKPLDTKRIRDSITKLGASPFQAESVFIENDKKGFLSAGDINALRRSAVEKLMSERSKRKPHESFPWPGLVSHNRDAVELTIAVEAQTEEQIKAAKKNGIQMIYAPMSLAKKFDGVIVIPSEIAVDNISLIPYDSLGIMHFSQIDSTKRLFGCNRLNIFNSYAADSFINFNTLTLSPELNLKEITQITKHTARKLEAVAYGRLTLMIMKNCPIKAAGKCQNHKPVYYLKDRKKQSFPLLCTEQCMLKLLNAKPLYMADKINDIKNTKINGIRLVFTIEDYEQCDKVIKEYQNAVQGLPCAPPEINQFTRGHFYRGVL